MTPLKDDILANIRKSSGKMKVALSDIRTSASNTRATLGKTATSPLVLLRLWSSCVLIHATQYLRYISDPAHNSEIQVAINTSLQDAMGCSNFPIGHPREYGYTDPRVRLPAERIMSSPLSLHPNPENWRGISNIHLSSCLHVCYRPHGYGKGSHHRIPEDISPMAASPPLTHPRHLQ